MKIFKLLCLFFLMAIAASSITGCISMVVNNQIKILEEQKQLAILEVNNDPFPIRIPSFTVQTTSPCPSAFSEYINEDFRRNISMKSGKAVGRAVLLMNSNTSSLSFDKSTDSVRVNYTMYLFDGDSTCIKKYDGHSVTPFKLYYVKTSAKQDKLSVIIPPYKIAYDEIRAQLKRDAQEINNLLLKK